MLSFFFSLPGIQVPFSLSQFAKEDKIPCPYRKLPQGPRGYPITRNVLDLQCEQWPKFTEWRKQYGQDAFNSQKVAAYLLNRYPRICADRPCNIVASDIMTGGLFTGFVRYGDVMSIVYDQPKLHINDFVERNTRAAYLGTYLVEFFPWMLHIPSRFVAWMRDAEAWCKHDTAVFEEFFISVHCRRHRHNSCKNGRCQRLSGTSLDRSLTAFDSFHFYRRTSAVMAWWTLAMLAYPEIQARAQAELDAVVGRTRLPNFADYLHFPYICAMVTSKEALRWRAVDPVGLPHRSLEDDWYEGHQNLDPDTYGEDATHFNPARHLYANGEIAPGPPDAKEKGHFAYDFANNSLFINIPTALGAQTRANEGPFHRQISSLEWMWTARWKLVLSFDPPFPHECDITPRFRKGTCKVVSNARNN
ncbi:cytochrome P450 [Lactarius akahatsu]|uniref:Cytochrome P450 n=1 Tax=Lactarius akahatsu TaxID=416441 RepID=A0AAD4LCK9_9AGAM|nr:cytochrome P450 [Lactarius akahatsu]